MSSVSVCVSTVPYNSCPLTKLFSTRMGVQQDSGRKRMLSLPFLGRSTWWTSTSPSPELAIRYLRIALPRCNKQGGEGQGLKVSHMPPHLPLVNQYFFMTLGRNHYRHVYTYVYIYIYNNFKTLQTFTSLPTQPPSEVETRSALFLSVALQCCQHFVPPS